MNPNPPSQPSKTAQRLKALQHHTANPMTSLRAADKTKPYIPLAGEAEDGWSSATEATASCFCGAVQLKFPTEAPGFVDSFICNCTDCHKITASMFASNFVVRFEHLAHLRGEENLSQFSTKKSIGLCSSLLRVLSDAGLILVSRYG
jgi:hypothetical protein